MLGEQLLAGQTQDKPAGEETRLQPELPHRGSDHGESSADQKQSSGTLSWQHESSAAAEPLHGGTHALRSTINRSKKSHAAPAQPEPPAPTAAAPVTAAVEAQPRRALVVRTAENRPVAAAVQRAAALFGRGTASDPEVLPDAPSEAAAAPAAADGSASEEAAEPGPGSVSLPAQRKVGLVGLKKLHQSTLQAQQRPWFRELQVGE